MSYHSVQEADPAQARGLNQTDGVKYGWTSGAGRSAYA